MMAESHPNFIPKETKQSNTDVQTSSVSPKEHSPRSNCANLEAETTEIEKLLHDWCPQCSQEITDDVLNHVVDIPPNEGVTESWHKQSIVILCMSAGGLITLFLNYLDELTPIFASAQPLAGGLGMPAHEFAWSLTFGGLVIMVYSLFFYPRDQKRWGYMKCCKIGLLLAAASTLILPFAHTFVQRQWATQACLFVGIGLTAIFKLMALASSSIIINTIAPMEQIGSVNGAAQTVQGLARSVGPFLAGIVWGSCADSGIYGKQYLPFLGSVIGLIATFILYMYIQLPA